MTNSFDLTETAELESSNDGEKVSHLASKVRNASPEFDGSDTQQDVIRAVLSDYLTELSEASEQASELQEATRERLGLTQAEEASDGTQSDSRGSQTEAEAKQDEIRSNILD
jgi:F0F1-type ATP synthase membrane subunit b/b'